MLQAIRLSFNKITLHLIVPITPLNCYSKKRRVSVRPSVRPYVRTFTKFSDFDVIWCVSRSRSHMRISVISTRSKIKVTVMELLKFRKLHYSRSISAIFTGSSKLMVAGDSMGPGVQLIRARFSNFLLGKLSRDFKFPGMSIFDKFQVAIFRYCVRI